MKPIVLHTGHTYSMEEKRRRKTEEDLYNVGRLKLTPPDELSRRAKWKFREIAGLAFWLDSLDCDFLAAYCQAWDRWTGVIEEMKDQGEIVLNEKKDGSVVAKQNPNRAALRSYLTIMEEMSQKLALSAVDRLRLQLPADGKKQEENPFEEFMTKVE